ncbi:hypothetical protein DSECCO2_166980 [anaerobic digester metagenome]
MNNKKKSFTYTIKIGKVIVFMEFKSIAKGRGGFLSPCSMLTVEKFIRKNKNVTRRGDVLEGFKLYLVKRIDYILPSSFILVYKICSTETPCHWP